MRFAPFGVVFASLVLAGCYMSHPGMDSNEMDGTDWGEDDGSPKCGLGPVRNGVWQLWVREP